MNKNNLLVFIKEIVESVLDLDEAKFNPRRDFDQYPLDKKFLSDSLLNRIIYVRDQLKLPKLGAGSARTVFLLDSKKVLKLASNRKGIGQNEAELDAVTNPSLKPIFAKIYDYSPDFSWLISELVKPLNSYTEFEQLTGIDFYNFSYMLMNAAYFGHDQEKLVNHLQGSAKNDEEFAKIENLRDSMLVKHVLLALKNGRILPGDLERIEHWGKTPDQRVVLLDYGFTVDVSNKYY